ncbi:nucleotide-diphospho-sugar transferase [Trichodelitschia bisporula]|uniref:dolichyl-phosphate beta-glucosyltransferase n=1 Tax=Trichodelitschia bisporula TaxID=703511 RepID=A0A6G1HXW7_9PEZI|nr:nucleotide-diphospho-sugar transferase [Trichodelitschia bisporula]
MSALAPVLADALDTLRQIPLPVLLAGLAALVLAVALSSYTLLTLVAPRPRPPTARENTYRTNLPPTGAPSDSLPLPSAYTSDPFTLPSSSVYISVVVPAYNEAARLPGMLEEAIEVLQSVYTPLGLEWEIIVVSDGSSDATVRTALEFAVAHARPEPVGVAGPWREGGKGTRIPHGVIRVVELERNRGKGGAVVHGLRHVRGLWVLFADADGATRFADLPGLVKVGAEKSDAQHRVVVVGSRAHLVGSEAVVKRSLLRNFLMHCFHLLIRLMTPAATSAIRDTQCGFKLLSRAALPHIVPHMHSEGWIFDIELLMLAEAAGIPMAEVPVAWKEVGGSKLSVIKDSIAMAWGLAVLRAAWAFGVYKR